MPPVWKFSSLLMFLLCKDYQNCRFIVVFNVRPVFITTMAAHQCAAAGDDKKVMKCQFQIIGEAITDAFQGNAQAQQAQCMTQAYFH